MEAMKLLYSSILEFIITLIFTRFCNGKYSCTMVF